MNSPYMGDFKVTQEYKGNDHDGLDLIGIASKEIHSTVKWNLPDGKTVQIKVRDLDSM